MRARRDRHASAPSAAGPQPGGAAPPSSRRPAGAGGRRGARPGGGRLHGDRHHPVGSSPIGVAVDPAARTAYVTNFGNDAVSVIDEATRT